VRIINNGMGRELVAAVNGKMKKQTLSALLGDQATAVWLRADERVAVRPRLWISRTLVKPLLSFKGRVEIPFDFLTPVKAHFQVDMRKALLKRGDRRPVVWMPKEVTYASLGLFHQVGFPARGLGFGEPPPRKYTQGRSKIGS
jgi:hypothetical protein